MNEITLQLESSLAAVTAERDSLLAAQSQLELLLLSEKDDKRKQRIQLESMLALAGLERDGLAARNAELESMLLVEQNSRRAALEEVAQVKLRFDPEIKAAEIAKLAVRRDELLAEVEHINKEIAKGTR